MRYTHRTRRTHITRTSSTVALAVGSVRNAPALESQLTSSVACASARHQRTCACTPPLPTFLLNSNCCCSCASSAANSASSLAVCAAYLCQKRACVCEYTTYTTQHTHDTTHVRLGVRVRRERRLDERVELLVALAQQRHGVSAAHAHHAHNTLKHTRIPSVVVADDAVLGHGVSAGGQLGELARAGLALLVDVVDRLRALVGIRACVCDRGWSVAHASHVRTTHTTHLQPPARPCAARPARRRTRSRPWRTSVARRPSASAWRARRRRRHDDP
jgi:hypothetical protein